MEKTDIILCLKKRKTKRISKKLLWGQKIKIKIFDFYFFSQYKNGTKCYLFQRKWNHKKHFL